MGGRLIVGLQDGSGLDLPDYRAPSINFTNDIVPVTVTPGEPLPDTWLQLELPTHYLTDGGFTRTELFSNGVISVGADVNLDLAAGSSVRLQGSVVDVAGNIRRAGRRGCAEVRARQSRSSVASGARRPGVFVADDVAIDVSGRWVNDLPEVAGDAPQDPLLHRRRPHRPAGFRPGWRAGAGQRRAGSAPTAAPRWAPMAALTRRSRWRHRPAGARAPGGLRHGQRTATLRLCARQRRQPDPRCEPPARRRAAVRHSPRPSGPTRRPATTRSPVATGLFQDGGFASFRLVALRRPVGRRGQRVRRAADRRGGRDGRTAGLAAVARSAASGRRRAAPTCASSPRCSCRRADVRPAASVAFAVTPHSQVTPATAGDLLLAAGSTVRVEPTGKVEFSGPDPHPARRFRDRSRRPDRGQPRQSPRGAGAGLRSCRGHLRGRQRPARCAGHCDPDAE